MRHAPQYRSSVNGSGQGASIVLSPVVARAATAAAGTSEISTAATMTIKCRMWPLSSKV